MSVLVYAGRAGAAGFGAAARGAGGRGGRAPVSPEAARAVQAQASPLQGLAQGPAPELAGQPGAVPAGWFRPPQLVTSGRARANAMRALFSILASINCLEPRRSRVPVLELLDLLISVFLLNQAHQIELEHQCGVWRNDAV